MEWSVMFFLNSLLLGVGLAMDAFSVALVSGLSETNMKRRKMALVAGVFSCFQLFMPLLGWVCVHTVAQLFSDFQKLIPWIALVLLCFIGGKMLYEGLHKKETEAPAQILGLGTLLVQGVATSIDALSVGFTIAEYNFVMALVCCLLIGAVTFVLCYLGVSLGKKFGTAFAGKASVLGGAILILIGLEIFITGIVG
ncbi:MAG: manganese efflux pump [Clostridia bacterium]|nr:manganese efflux pump [Clostridia bacterium]